MGNVRKSDCKRACGFFLEWWKHSKIRWLYNSVNILKSIDLYTLNWWILWCVNYISIKLLLKALNSRSKENHHLVPYVLWLGLKLPQNCCLPEHLATIKLKPFTPVTWHTPGRAACADSQAASLGVVLASCTPVFLLRIKGPVLSAVEPHFVTDSYPFVSGLCSNHPVQFRSDSTYDPEVISTNGTAPHPRTCLLSIWALSRTVTCLCSDYNSHTNSKISSFSHAHKHQALFGGSVH